MKNTLVKNSSTKLKQKYGHESGGLNLPTKIQNPGFPRCGSSLRIRDVRKLQSPCSLRSFSHFIHQPYVNILRNLKMEDHPCSYNLRGHCMALERRRRGGACARPRAVTAPVECSPLCLKITGWGACLEEKLSRAWESSMQASLRSQRVLLAAQWLIS